MMLAVDEQQDHRTFCKDRAKRLIGEVSVSQNPNAPPTESIRKMMSLPKPILVSLSTFVEENFTLTM